MVVPNEQLKQLTIEKRLMQNGKVGVALISIGLNVVVSLVVVYGGYLVGQYFSPDVVS